MNERLTLQDLIDSLSQKQGMTKKDAETFLRELIAVISETIEQNDSVKIKDFGTFKLVKVNSRKSVDVNTGEAIEIPAHYKLTFTPEKSLKEAVNHPFAHFESVVLEEGVSFENIEISEVLEDAEEEIEDEAETDEIVETPIIIESVNTSEKETETVSVEDSGPVAKNLVDDAEPEEVVEIIDGEKEQEVILNPILEPEERGVISEAPTQEDKTEENSVEEPKTKSDKDQQPVNIEKTSEGDRNTESQEMFERHARKTVRRRFISMSFIVPLILGAFALGGLYFQEIMKCFSGQLNENKVEVAHEQKIVTMPSKPEIDSITVAVSEPDSVVATKQEPLEEFVAQSSIIKDTIKSGKTLRLISLKHYGHRSFWPYIYEENRDVIKNPNNVPIGTELIIPAPEKYGIDAKNKESVEKAKVMESKLVKELDL